MRLGNEKRMENYIDGNNMMGLRAQSPTQTAEGQNENKTTEIILECIII